MDRYVNYCTQIQAERALKLGAPLEYKSELCVNCQYGHWYEYYRETIGEYILPTTQQMISWLESQNIQFDITPYIEGYVIKVITYYQYNSPYKVIDLDTKLDAIMAAIDSALDYLEENKGKDPLFDSFREKLNNIKEAHE